MAISTPKTYRNQLIYSVFVRNYSPEGTFEALRRDLERIRELGTDIIWLMPIHPLGEKARKGTLGSPYAIRDYRAVNPEFGTLEDFRRLVDDIHALGMKCIIDVVYNHTSPDSWLVQNHPEWFYRKADGNFGNKVGDWTDIIDLDYRNRALWDYQIETLKQWAAIVDGFRCDVAPMVPMEFWMEARRAVEEVRPGCFWLAETVEPGFVAYNRSQGMVCHSDCETFQAFDACYDYDTASEFIGYLTGELPLVRYAEAVTRQETTYPENYLKLRFLENHDRPRAAQLIGDEKALMCWMAFLYFQKGITLLYNGQEVGAVHLPSLFDRDTIRWDTGKDYTSLLKKLKEIKADPLFADSSYQVTALPNDVLLAVHERCDSKLVGIFPAGGKASLVKPGVADGTYRNLLSDTPVEVHFGMTSCTEPIIFKA
jgi:glycosidase